MTQTSPFAGLFSFPFWRLAAAGLLMATAVAGARASGWERAGSVSAGAGYAENALLSSVAPENGPFVRAGFEGMAWRALGERGDFSAILSGERSHFVGELSRLNDDQYFLGQVSVGFKKSDKWRGKLRVRSLFNESVMDFSENEASRVVVPVQVFTGAAGASVRWEPFRGFSLEPEGEYSEHRYHGYRGNFGESRFRILTRFERGHWALELRAEAGRRNYKDRTEYTATGRPLPGARLKTLKTRAEALVRWSPPAFPKLKLSAGAGLQKTDDGASGFFDTRRNEQRVKAAWEGARWNWEVSVARLREIYRVQTVGTGIHPEARSSTDTEIEARLEREISEKWSVVASLEKSRTQANSREFTFKTVTVSGALERHF